MPTQPSRLAYGLSFLSSEGSTDNTK